MNRVYRSSQSDLDAITACHRLCFKDSLSVKLGAAYTKKSLAWFLAADNRFLLHTTAANNETTGYVGGFISQYEGDGSASGMLQYALREAFKGVITHPWLLLNKELIKYYPLIIKNVTGKFKRPVNTTTPPPPKKILTTGLVIIGVSPSHRGSGIFESLIHAFEEEATARAIATISLSVKKTNTRALAAYKKAGFYISKEVPGAYEMIKTLDT